MREPVAPCQHSIHDCCHLAYRTTKSCYPDKHHTTDRPSVTRLLQAERGKGPNNDWSWFLLLVARETGNAVG